MQIVVLPYLNQPNEAMETFGVDKAITDWRRRMLAAGISAAVLDELESHLREEFEERKKSGSNDIGAFHAAIREIGTGNELSQEFKGIEDVTERITNSLIQIIGWIGVGSLLLFGWVELTAGWHRWEAWSIYFLAAACQILAAEAGIWLLAKANRDVIGRAVALLICLFLGWVAVAHYSTEMTPLMVVTFLMPGIFWISRQWSSRRAKKETIAPAIIVAERAFSLIAAFYIIFNSIWFFHTAIGAKYHSTMPDAMRWVIHAARVLEFLLIIYAGCLAYTHIDKMRRARTLAE